jgi:hypothetical protein
MRAFGGIDMKIISDYQDRWLIGGISSVQLTDFPIYGSRLEMIHQRMKDWHPECLSDLLIKPYRNPLLFYTFWFATSLAIVTMGLVLLSYKVSQDFRIIYNSQCISIETALMMQ